MVLASPARFPASQVSPLAATAVSLLDEPTRKSPVGKTPSSLDAATQATLDATQAAAATDALVFPHAEGGCLYGDNFRKRTWQPLLTALRHTFSVLHLQSPTDPTWVQGQLGHHTVSYTLTAYAHRPKRDERRYANALDRPSAPNAPANAPDVPSAADEPTPETTKALASQGLSRARPG